MGWRWGRSGRSQEYLADTMAELLRRRRQADAIARERHNARRVAPADTSPPAAAVVRSIRHDTTAFHLPATIEPVPGLLEEVLRLQETGTPRQALDLVLRVLRKDPRSADAHRCALVLCSALTVRSPAADPVTEEQLYDPLLDPVRTVCTSCGKEWFSHHNLIPEGSGIVALNPIGLQCQVCRYTVCRDCLSPDRRCPQGCAGELGTPVLATGRPATPRPAAVEYLVAVAEQGTPRPEELFDLFHSNNPDIDLIGAGFQPTTAFPGVDDTFGYFLVMRLEREGRVRPDALHRTRMTSSRHPVFGIVRFYLVEARSGPA